jgi:biopolymer transport protein ExbD
MLIKVPSLDDKVSMQMTPLIDVVFLLLIFFLVATTFQQAEREMQIALPVAKSAAPLSAMLRELVVNVDAEGTIIVAGRQIETAELEQMVREAVAANPEQKVTVRGDRHAAYGHVVAVLDVCKRSGIQEPYLDTVLE